MQAVDPTASSHLCVSLCLSLVVGLVTFQSRCVAIPTSDGSVTPEVCVFHSNCQGHIYQSCNATPTDPNQKEWRVLEVDESNKYIRATSRRVHCDFRTYLAFTQDPPTIPASNHHHQWGTVAKPRGSQSEAFPPIHKDHGPDLGRAHLCSTQMSGNEADTRASLETCDPQTWALDDIPELKSDYEDDIYSDYGDDSGDFEDGPTRSVTSSYGGDDDYDYGSFPLDTNGTGQYCTTISGPRANRLCVFPFIYDGTNFNECTNRDDPDSKPWCSTLVDALGNHIPGNWGHCSCSSKVTTLETCDGKTIEEIKLPTSGTFLPNLENCGSSADVGRILGEFPFPVLLGYSRTEKRYRCGGSLINARYVLTAAHCTGKIKPVEVLVGDHDLRQQCDCLSDQNCAAHPQRIPIEKVISHPQYASRQAGYNDIALLRLSRPARLSQTAQLICLPVDPEATANFLRVQNMADGLLQKLGTLVGWGRTSASASGSAQFGASTPVLQKVAFPIIACRQDNPNEICAGELNKDACFGDSGGPLIVDGQDGRMVQIGVVSRGDRTCRSKTPGIYTRVSEYISWIQQNLEP
eukprot:maker-scaffold1402_size43054-snap-gene-0.8 protein:Tk02458 transcript:maker-scaffold1402_size43054-snap-gene-0.8-mRNA-1 annotation:"hemolymph proteinase 5"